MRRPQAAVAEQAQNDAVAQGHSSPLPEEEEAVQSDATAAQRDQKSEFPDGSPGAG